MSDEIWIVGPEYDSALFLKLGEALKSCGYAIGEESSGIGGSQEVTQWKLFGPQGTLVVESETFIGLSVQGPKNQVQEVRAKFQYGVSPA